MLRKEQNPLAAVEDVIQGCFNTYCILRKYLQHMVVLCVVCCVLCVVCCVLCVVCCVLCVVCCVLCV